MNKIKINNLNLITKQSKILNQEDYFMDLEENKISNTNQTMINPKLNLTNKEEEVNQIISLINKDIMKMVKIMGTEEEVNIIIKEVSQIIEVETIHLKTNKKMNIKGEKQISSTKQSSNMGMKTHIQMDRLREVDITTEVKIRRTIILFTGIIFIIPQKIIDLISIYLV